jgi:tetratricopeptide (TPR) repeat protein
MQDYSQAISANSNDPKAFFDRGKAKMMTGDAQGAIADFNQVLQLDSNRADAYYHRGILLARTSDRRSALSDFQRAADLYLLEGNAEGYRNTLEKLQQIQR